MNKLFKKLFFNEDFNIVNIKCLGEKEYYFDIKELPQYKYGLKINKNELNEEEYIFFGNRIDTIDKFKWTAVDIVCFSKKEFINLIEKYIEYHNINFFNRIEND